MLYEYDSLHCIINGDLIISGVTTTVDSTNLSVTDNMITINDGEKLSGVSLGQAGIKIDRGIVDPYVFIFDESSSTFRVGSGIEQVDGTFLDDDLQAVATREDAPLNNGFAYWDNVSFSFKTRNLIKSDVGLDNIPNLDQAGMNYWTKTDNDLSYTGDVKLTGNFITNGHAVYHTSNANLNTVTWSVDDATLNDLYFDNNPAVYLYQYSESSGDWTTISDLNAPLVPGIGYSVYVSDSKEKKQNVTAVDMETAAMLAFAEKNNLNCSAIFAVSDILRPDSWEPNFLKPQITKSLAEVLQALTI
jgi:hypothetical protein